MDLLLLALYMVAAAFDQVDDLAVVLAALGALLVAGPRAHRRD